MKKIKILMTILCVTFLALIMVSSASALTITPDTLFQWTGCDPKNPDADSIPAIVNYGGTLDELYKQDVANEGALVPPPDVGPFASSYVTTFSNSATDPEDATITYNLGQPVITGDPLYLLVKDGGPKYDDQGNLIPCWYIFDLVELSWNGTDTIDLEDFWSATATNTQGNGAISHVSIYGSTPVPEPTTLLLLGFGLIGLAGFRRR